jgi:hypothetical protein
VRFEGRRPDADPTEIDGHRRTLIVAGHIAPHVELPTRKASLLVYGHLIITSATSDELLVSEAFRPRITCRNLLSRDPGPGTNSDPGRARPTGVALIFSTPTGARRALMIDLRFMEQLSRSP